MSYFLHAKKEPQATFSLLRSYTASREVWKQGRTHLPILAILILLLPAFIAQAAQQELVILKATYTGGEVEKDVTAILQKLTLNGNLQLDVQNEQLGGDPQFGKVKTLAVTYRDASGTYSISATEGERLTIPNPKATSLSPASASQTSGSTSYAERGIEPELKSSSAEQTGTKSELDLNCVTPEGIFSLIQRVSLVTDTGVTAFAVGTRVEKIGDADGKIKVKAGQQEFEVEPEKLTNDLALAEALVGTERAAHQKAKTQAAADEKAEAEKRAKLQNARRIRGTVVQVTDKGLLLDCEVRNLGGASSMQSIGGGGTWYIPPDPNGKGRPPEEHGTFWLVGHPKLGSKVEGEAVDVDAYLDGLYSYTTVMGAERRIKRYQVVKSFQ